jgi:hypothetical protein
VAEQLHMPPPSPAPSYAAAAGERADPATGGGSAPPAPGAPGRVRVISWAARARRDAGPIGWAAFLASSWTWCIGMFLPVLMVRDYGGWGWTVFALPNVLGAAAMGWVLRDAAASRTVQQAHQSACRWFSLVTIAFHAYFVLALLPSLIGDTFIGLAVAMIPLVAVLWGRRGRRATLTGALALALSVLSMLGYLALQGLPHAAPPAKPRVDLLWLGPVCAFGFFLCPYLDLTFHRARQSSTRAGGKTAFGLGFGAFFLLMIVFTALYAQPLAGALAGARHYSVRGDLFVGVLAVHLATQAAFTVVAHAAAVRDAGPPDAAGWWLRAFATTVGIVALALLLRWTVEHYPVYRGLWGQRLATSELIYRLFMAFYGLVFPTYVWLFMVPSLRRRRPVAAQPPRPATIVFFAGVLALAAPGFWMGFIEGRMLWLAPAIVLVLVSRALLPKGPPVAEPVTE